MGTAQVPGGMDLRIEAVVSILLSEDRSIIRQNQPVFFLTRKIWLQKPGELVSLTISTAFFSSNIYTSSLKWLRCCATGNRIGTKTMEVPLQKESCSPSPEQKGPRNPELWMTKPPQNLTDERLLEEKDEVQMEGPWWRHLPCLAWPLLEEDDDPPRPPPHPLVDRNQLKETEDEEVGTCLLAFDSPSRPLCRIWIKRKKKVSFWYPNLLSNFFSGGNDVYRLNSLWAWKGRKTQIKKKKKKKKFTLRTSSIFPSKTEEKFRGAAQRLSLLWDKSRWEVSRAALRCWCSSMAETDKPKAMLCSAERFTTANSKLRRTSRSTFCAEGLKCSWAKKIIMQINGNCSPGQPLQVL